jgi:hypothetical protein
MAWRINGWRINGEANGESWRRNISVTAWRNGESNRHQWHRQRIGENVGVISNIIELAKGEGGEGLSACIG